MNIWWKYINNHNVPHAAILSCAENCFWQLLLVVPTCIPVHGILSFVFMPPFSNFYFCSRSKRILLFSALICLCFSITFRSVLNHSIYYSYTYIIHIHLHRLVCVWSLVVCAYHFYYTSTSTCRTYDIDCLDLFLNGYRPMFKCSLFDSIALHRFFRNNLI